MTSILLIVDPQKDFCEGGALPVAGGNAAMEKIGVHLREHVNDYNAILVSQDWHEDDSLNGGHFHAEGDSPDYANTWPWHCVQNTEGAEIHPAVAQALPPGVWRVIKGMGEPAYSLFEGAVVHFGHRPPAELIAELTQQHGDPLTIHVMGLATDYCVNASGVGAKQRFPEAEVVVYQDMCAGVAEGTTQQALTSMSAQGILIK